MLSATDLTDVTIIGAGPYGLSLAAHLRASGVKYRIFGECMQFWRDLPAGLNLKSLAFATSIDVPVRGHTFPDWCRRNGVEDFEPCTMESFAAYGYEMQKRFVPDLEEVFVTNVVQGNGHFVVTLASGETVHTRNVVVATGLSGLAKVPDTFQHLPADRVRHTFHISDYSQYCGKSVAVIGGGASAIEAGTLVQEAGGSSQIYLRGPEAIFHGRTPRKRPLFERIKNPIGALGASRRSWVLQHFPLLVYRLPLKRRTRFVSSQYGPASPWWIKDRVLGKVPIRVSHEIVTANLAGDRIRLNLKNGDGRTKDVDVDYVIAGTGYDVSLSRLHFLDPSLAKRIQRIETAPHLNSYFESSVRGLYFVGPLSNMSFGPLFRFVAGASVAARRLSRRLSC
jgi:FAD-dependent urate hydroxylase